MTADGQFIPNISILDFGFWIGLVLKPKLFLNKNYSLAKILQ
jgi:hypothetical protein